jgi:hypothetical protein
MGNKSEKKMTYIIDIDGTICTNTWGRYELAVPFISRIGKINKLFDQGNIIIYHTARGSTTGVDWSYLTEEQFKEWGVKYNKIVYGKIQGDIFIDDKGVNADDFFKE